MALDGKGNCEQCGGTGKVKKPGIITGTPTEYPCPACRGKGTNELTTK